MKNVKAATLATIASELRTRYEMATQAAFYIENAEARLSALLITVINAAALAADSKAAGDAEMAAWHTAHGRAAKAEYLALAADLDAAKAALAEAEITNDLSNGLKRAA